jgi:predicted DNA-binding transcriptional regulator AlpA
MFSLVSSGEHMNEQYVTSRQVKARYGGVSDMTIWRWLRDRNLNFPQPLVINGRRLWRLDALEDWEARQVRRRLYGDRTAFRSAGVDQAAPEDPG